MKILMVISLLLSGCTTIEVINSGSNNTTSINQERASLLNPDVAPADGDIK